MAVITPTAMGNGRVTVAKTTLTATDTFVFNPRVRQILVLENETGIPATVTIVGDDVTSVQVPGVGAVDISAGFTGVIADGARVAIDLGTIREYLRGDIEVTGGIGLVASLLVLA